MSLPVRNICIGPKLTDDSGSLLFLSIQYYLSEFVGTIYIKIFIKLKRECTSATRSFTSSNNRTYTK